MEIGANPLETVELKIEKQNVPGFSSNVFVNRVYIKLGGKWVETYKTADCPRHLITADKTRHFCIGHNDTIKELPPVTVPFMCGNVCDEMKRQFRKVIEEHGAYLTESEKQYMQDYIAKENTVEWDDGYKEAVT